ncbi:LOW QUALITY PROTEIN: hypothetical protein U9M48_026405 [Paspalum notatum var. saurae]|uniref:Uncharacterized protein n=1 Tax=Paspalum notatum var. saurae TaxID=547442 RepID=A0AAQ3WYA4_PASNO
MGIPQKEHSMDEEDGGHREGITVHLRAPLLALLLFSFVLHVPSHSHITYTPSQENKNRRQIDQASPSVGEPAVAAYLAVGRRPDPDPAEPGHGRGEVGEEGALVVGVAVDGAARPGVRVQHLVRPQQPLPGAQVPYSLSNRSGVAASRNANPAAPPGHLPRSCSANAGSMPASAPIRYPKKPHDAAPIV